MFTERDPHYCNNLTSTTSTNVLQLVGARTPEIMAPDLELLATHYTYTSIMARFASRVSYFWPLSLVERKSLKATCQALPQKCPSSWRQRLQLHADAGGCSCGTTPLGLQRICSCPSILQLYGERFSAAFPTWLPTLGRTGWASIFSEASS